MTIKLTGKTRYRNYPRFFGSTLLVLQVEESVTGQYHTYNEGGRVESDPLPDSLRWRDATIFDLQELNL